MRDLKFGNFLRYLRDRLTRRVEFVLRNEIAQRDSIIAKLERQQTELVQRIATLEPLLTAHHQEEQRLATLESLITAHQQAVQKVASLEPLLDAHKQIAQRVAALEPLLTAHEQFAQKLEPLLNTRQQIEQKIAVFEPLLNAHQRLSQQVAALEVDLEAVHTGVLRTETALVDALYQQMPLFSGAAHSQVESLPLVSIVLPTRNRSSLVGDAIRSVVAQRYQRWELLIVDDGSTDNTEEIVRPFLTDDRIHYFSRPALGHSFARNHGLQQSRGELVAYIDSDNVWFPGFLSGMIEAFQSDRTLQNAYGMLVADDVLFSRSLILWKPFDREALLRNNYIDLGTFIHRKSLFEKRGGFDEDLKRVSDWDLILRYTEDTLTRAVPVLSTYYRTRAADRVTNRVDFGSNWFRVSRKWLRRPDAAHHPRVLYLLGHPQQTSARHVETEIRTLQRLGAEIEAWSEYKNGDTDALGTRLHRDTLASAMSSFKPDIVHIQGISEAVKYEPIVMTQGVPITVRAGDREETSDTIRELLARSSIQRLFLFPYQLADIVDPRIRLVSAAFDSTLFRPSPQKDRRVVLQVAAFPSTDIGVFFEIAKALPNHRFMLATCADIQGAFSSADLSTRAQQLRSPVDLRCDIGRDEVAHLMSGAGLYLHTVSNPDPQSGLGAGMPISIAEAMATGSITLVRDLHPLPQYVSEAGMTYRDVDDAVRLIRASEEWSDEDWRRATVRSLDRAWLHHADETTLHPILQDWCELVRPH